VSHTEGVLFNARFLGFGLAAVGHYALAWRWLTGAGLALAGLACLSLVGMYQRRPPGE
jgi:hypothetical protein